MLHHSGLQILDSEDDCEVSCRCVLLERHTLGSRNLMRFLLDCICRYDRKNIYCTCSFTHFLDQSVELESFLANCNIKSHVTGEQVGASVCCSDTGQILEIQQLTHIYNTAAGLFTEMFSNLKDQKWSFSFSVSQAFKKKKCSHCSSVERVATVENMVSCFYTENGFITSVPLLFTIMTYLIVYGNTYNMTVCHWSSIFCDCKLFLS